MEDCCENGNELIMMSIAIQCSQKSVPRVDSFRHHSFGRIFGILLAICRIQAVSYFETSYSMDSVSISCHVSSFLLSSIQVHSVS
jgi:hypothetical protein